MIPKLAGYDIPTAEEMPKNKVDWFPDASRAVLLVHDMQDYFLDFWGDNSEFVNKLVQNIAILKNYCHAAKIPVFYTAQPINQKPEDRALMLDVWGKGIDNRPERKDIVSGLAPKEGDRVLVKHRYSAFQRSDLAQTMKAEGRDQIIICGVYAHIGCLATAIEAFMLDIQPFFIGDCLGDFTKEKHLTALQMAAEFSGSVLPLQKVTSGLVEADLRTVILQALDGDDEDWPEADESLIDYGVNSVQIMNMVSRWRHVRPHLDFVTLAQSPTLESWRRSLL